MSTPVDGLSGGCACVAYKTAVGRAHEAGRGEQEQGQGKKGASSAQYT